MDTSKVKDKDGDTSKALVVIGEDGVEYSLLKGPDDESQYVVEAHLKLTESLQINEVATDLSNVGKFILMAYCGVMGHLQLEMQVRDRLHSVVKLCDDTVHTLNEFSRASNTAIASMGTAYEYLLDGFEDIALETLQDVAQISKDMQTRSLELQNRFGNEADEVKKVHDATASEKQKVFDANVATKKNMTIFASDKSTANKELAKAEEEEENTMKVLNTTLEEEKKTAEERRKIAANLAREIDQIQLESSEADEKEIAFKPQTGIFSKIKSGFTHYMGGQTDDDIQSKKIEVSKRTVADKQSNALLKAKELKEAEDKKAKLLKEQREMHARLLEERAKKRQQALKEMAEAAKKLQECKFEHDIQTESLFCLHHALTALRHLQDIMTVAANFWRETHAVCSELSGAGISKHIDRLLKMPEDRRLKLWNAKAFKMEAIHYYSNWVAVRKLCVDSRASITKSQRQVHLFIRANPTKTEAKEILQTLAEEFKTQVDSNEKASKQKQITDGSDEHENQTAS